MLHFELHPVYIHAVIVFGQHTDSFLLRQDVKTAKEKKHHEGKAVVSNAVFCAVTFYLESLTCH